VVLSDYHGGQSIAKANPHALVVVVSSWPEILELARALSLGARSEIEGQPAFKFLLGGREVVIQTVVWDNLDDTQEMAIAYLEGAGGIDDDKKEKTGELSQAGWGRVFKLMRGLIKGLRALPVNVVMVAGAAERETSKGAGTYRVVPAVDGKLRAKLGGWCHAIGYTRVRLRDGSPTYEICFRLGQSFDTKPAPGFPASIENTLAPGQTTLGSLLFAQAERYWPAGTVVPHTAGDSASWVGPEITEEQQAQQQEKPRVTAVRQRG